jgi:hypothetical protein
MFSPGGSKLRSDLELLGRGGDQAFARPAERAERVEVFCPRDRIEAVRASLAFDDSARFGVDHGTRDAHGLAATCALRSPGDLGSPSLFDFGVGLGSAEHVGVGDFVLGRLRESGFRFELHVDDRVREPSDKPPSHRESFRNTTNPQTDAIVALRRQHLRIRYRAQLR